MIRRSTDFLSVGGSGSQLGSSFANPMYVTASLTVNASVSGGGGGFQNVTASLDRQRSLIDSGNSSTALLGAYAAFTGSGVDVSGYGTLHVFYFADTSGTLKLQFSTDNSNWDNSLTYLVTAGQSDHVQIGPQAQYYRTVFGNGGTGQGTFRLQTFYQPAAAYAPVVQVGSATDPTGDAIQTKAVITGRTSAGGTTYVDVKVSPAGAVQVGGTLDGITNPITASIVGGNLSITGSITQVTASVPVTDTVVSRRFGVCATSSSLTVVNAGITTLYQPATGKSVLWKWVGLATPDTNTAPVVVQVYISGGNGYTWPLPSPGIFQHGFVRSGSVNAPLLLSSSAGQTVYANWDVEDI